MRPNANTAWFTFSSKADPPGGFGVYEFCGNEAVCEPYEFEIELVSRSANVDITALTGQQAFLSITDRSGGTRLVHGIIRHMEQRHTANVFTHYKCWLVPRLWFLDQIRDHRIFQNLSVDGIIQKILREQGFTAEQYAFKLCYTYQPREYCVQYGETDLHFITRLCEEEGIYFYFEHSEDGHCLCFCDREGGPKISGEWDLRFFPGSGQASDSAVINRLHLHYGVNSNAAMYREWNFQTPKIDLTFQEREPDAQKAPVPPGMLLEQYQYPHLYEDRDQGRRYAKLQVDRQLTFTRWIDCQSDVSRHLPSYVFSIHEHPRKDVNARWWIVRVLHSGKQPGVLEHEAPDGRGQEYQSAVQAIPDMTRFIPSLEHPKNLVKGQQTAIVTGPDGEEIYVDKYGRVKVQFFWDREGKWDEQTTCWIRVSQGWGGAQYGAMAIPRIGHEVIVSFLEGNPDRPLITGRVYHALNMPPYTLPEHKTRTVFKSMSTLGKEGEARGFNEFRVEDKRGQEEISLHAEKDVNAYVKNDWKEHILHDKHRTTDHFTYLETKGETHETLRDQRKTELFANDNLTVHGDSHTKADGKWQVKAGEEAHAQAGLKVVVEAGSELTVEAGGQFLRINSSGIRVSAGLQVGAGRPSKGWGAQPVLPDGTVSVDEAGKPVAPEQRKEAKEDINPAADGSAAASPLPLGMDMAEYKDSFKFTQNCHSDRVAAALESVKDMKPGSKEGKAWAEMLENVGKQGSTLTKAQKVEYIVNSNIGYMKDRELYKLDDYWATPKETLSWGTKDEKVKGLGDCEDFALLKYALLAESGVPVEDMAILTVEDSVRSLGDENRYHAVLHVKDKIKDKQGNIVEKNYILDNNRPLANSSEIDQSTTKKYKPLSKTTNSKCHRFIKK